MTLPEDTGPVPRLVPLKPEPPLMTHRVEDLGRIFGQNSQGWLICWSRISGEVLWEVPSHAIVHSPGVTDQGLVTITWSGLFELRSLETGELIWSTRVPSLALYSWDRYKDFFRIAGVGGRLLLLDILDGSIAYDRPEMISFRTEEVEKWVESYPWVLDTAVTHSSESKTTSLGTLPPVPEELVRWLSGKNKDPSEVYFYPIEQNQVGFPRAAEETFILFSAWKSGTYTFSSPTGKDVPLKIALKDFGGAEMDSNMGYGEMVPTVSWKMKKGEPVLLHLVLINPDHEGQGVMLQVDIK